MTEQTKTKRRHLTIVLDRSGSMHIVRSDTEGGLASFIEEQTKVTEELGCVTTVTLIDFNTTVNPVYRNKLIQQVERYELHPHGGTALLDAIGTAIFELDERLVKLTDATRPDEVVVVILTDGEENSSREHNLEEIKGLITARTEAGWQFIFLGADQDAISAGTRMGMLRGQTVAYDSINTRAAWGTVSAMTTRGTMGGGYTVTEAEREGLSKEG